MANTDKNILITPNIGSTTDDPKIVFSGADSSTTAQNITLYTYPESGGTLSFEGSEGQLFSITNDFTGTIFSVNDVSGIPSIEVEDDGTVKFAEYAGNILIGTDSDDGSNKLQVNGNIYSSGNITADGLTVDGTATIDGGSGIPLTIDADAGANTNIQFSENGSLRWYLRSVTSSNDFNFYGNGQSRLNIGSGGDISFYEDTGSTPKFFWDASAESLGIGTSSPSEVLDISLANNTGAIAGLKIANTDTGTTSNYSGIYATAVNGTIGMRLNAAQSTSMSARVLIGSTTAHPVSFVTSDTERMRIDSSGNVGIGTTSPSIRLTVRKDDATDGQHLATFDGSDTNQSFRITNYFCGSDEDRVGVYWENQGTLNQRMWCDDTGDIRVSGSNPTADNSGTVVGTQTFTGTHIYKSSDESLITGEAVKLVDRKLVRCTVTKDPTCIGIFIGKSDKIQDSFEAPCSYDYWHDSVLYTDEDELPEGVVVGDVKTESYLEVKNPDEGYPYAVASLGDTIANVSGNKLEGVLVDCSVTAGDLLCTAVDGRLTKQDDDIIHSYTVAKAGEDGDSNNPVYAYVYCG